VTACDTLPTPAACPRQQTAASTKAPPAATGCLCAAGPWVASVSRPTPGVHLRPTDPRPVARPSPGPGQLLVAHENA
jgi:hypothetical protein